MGLHECKGVREMTFVDGTMNTCLYIQILNEKMAPSLKKPGGRGMFSG